MSIVLYENNSDWSLREVLNRKNDELNAYHNKLIDKWNKLVDDFNKLHRDYTSLCSLKKDSDKEKEVLIYRNKYIEEENIKLKLEKQNNFN